jgi:hypothetical protein
MPARFAQLVHAGIDEAGWDVEPLLESADRDERDRGHPARRGVAPAGHGPRRSYPGPVQDGTARPGEPAALPAGAGLCTTCRHAMVRPTRRGTTYLRCTLASSDARFPKYPRLPVLTCEGHEPPATPRAVTP